MTTRSNMKTEISIKVITDYSAYNSDKIDGYRVCLFAGDALVFSVDAVHLEQANKIANEKRKLLGLARMFRCRMHSATKMVDRVDAFTDLIEASAWANKNAPADCTKIEVTEVTEEQLWGK